MTEKRSDKWVSLTLSVLVHGTVAGLLVWGYLFYKRDVKTPDIQLAIEATVVDSKTIPADVLKPTPPTTRQVRPPAPEVKPEPQVKPAPEPKPEPPPPEPTPPKPTPPPPDDSAKREQERKVEEQRVAAERERTEKLRIEQERADKERQEKERVAKEKAEKERIEKEKADQLAQQKAADERQRAQREAELRAQLAAEERNAAVRSSAVAQQYLAQIRARIERAWIRPPSARAGLACQIRITQVPSGEVVSAQVLVCNGDDAVRQSVEAAVYRASPLPVAPDPALFERNLVLNFRPEE